MPEIVNLDSEKKARAPKRDLLIETKKVKVTPAMAIKWLETSEAIEEIRNRGVSDGNVELFARTMVRGEWEINHQGIGIFRIGDGKDVIVDGQHRLWAVVKANIPVEMLVSFYSGSTEDAIEVMRTFDRGQKRSLGQVLKISRNIDRGGLRSSACRYLLAFLRTGGRGDYAALRITDSEILDCVERYQFNLDWLVTMRRGRAGMANTFLTAPVAAALIYAHSAEAYREGVEHFGRQLTGGEGLFAGDPAMSLREWIHMHEPFGNTEAKMLLMRIAFKAMQLAVQKKTTKRFEDNMKGFEFFREAIGEK
jgi:hypothetical protein